MPYKRILNSLPEETSKMEVKELVKKKYPKGSKHKCRVLNYNYMEKEYVCTFEAKILNEKIFTENDLKYGQLVNGKIIKINDKGITIKVGNLIGFIPNIHVSNSQFSENIKQNYKEGQTVRAKYVFFLLYKY